MKEGKLTRKQNNLEKIMEAQKEISTYINNRLLLLSYETSELIDDIDVRIDGATIHRNASSITVDVEVLTAREVVEKEIEKLKPINNPNHGKRK